MDGGCVERLGAVRNTQEARALFERTLAEPIDVQQLLAVLERTDGVAMSHDRLSQRGAEA